MRDEIAACNVGYSNHPCRLVPSLMLGHWQSPTTCQLPWFPHPLFLSSILPLPQHHTASTLAALPEPLLLPSLLLLAPSLLLLPPLPPAFPKPLHHRLVCSRAVHHHSPPPTPAHETTPENPPGFSKPAGNDGDQPSRRRGRAPCARPAPPVYPGRAAACFPSPGPTFSLSPTSWERSPAAPRAAPISFRLPPRLHPAETAPRRGNAAVPGHGELEGSRSLSAAAALGRAVAGSAPSATIPHTVLPPTAASRGVRRLGAVLPPRLSVPSGRCPCPELALSSPSVSVCT